MPVRFSEAGVSAGGGGVAQDRKRVGVETGVMKVSRGQGGVRRKRNEVGVE